MIRGEAAKQVICLVIDICFLDQVVFPLGLGKVDGALLFVYQTASILELQNRVSIFFYYIFSVPSYV